MRKLTTMLLSLALLIASVSATTAFAAEKVVVDTQKLVVNDRSYDKFMSYLVDGVQYVKIRDVAYILKDTSARFSVVFGNNIVEIKTNASYVANGTECKGRAVNYKSFTKPVDIVTINEKETDVKVVKIDGAYYVQLVDLAPVGIVTLANAAAKTVTVTTVPKEKTQLLVHAAASLADVLPEIAKEFSALYPNITLNFNTGGSGALTTQITQGAGGDLFISADEANMDKIKSSIVTSTRTDLLTNRIVLIVPVNNPKNIKTFEDVLDKTGSNDVIAIGDEKTVPNGKYAREVYKYMNKLSALEGKKLTLDDSVTKVLAHVASGDAVAGFVYATDAQGNDKVTVVSMAAERSHTPVVYPGAVLSDSKNKAAALAFLKYLSTDDAKALFTEAGFGVK